MAANPQTTQLIETSETQRQRYAEQAKRCTPKFLYRALKVLNQCDLSYRQSSNKRLLVELTLIQVAQITQEEDGESAGRGPRKRLKSLFSLLTFPKGTERKSVETVEKKETVYKTPETAGAKTVAEARPKVSLESLGGSFASLSNKKKQVQAVYSLGETANENAQFTESDVQREWLRMCNYMGQNPDEVALAARMHNVILHMTEFPEVEAVFENSMLLDDVERILPRVQNTLAKALHNGKLTIKTRLANDDEIVKKLSQKEIYDKLMEECPAFVSFQRELELKLE